ncbi:diaminopimelate decarboxylase [Rhodothalassium salexigens DSM 2132]|uniref:Diaminopimelate decarboxylase n=1 Tax=Rhodothalassium salexigens DSM 2132 TaxID=1188247 RepID=A0A4R2PLH4_RHOSA|nr:diaminopimelate decarboxylase [Rhodothalassium salexigens]MBB4210880.1 diaminopimelate decarboxylase [Rhodothalassium salexigens DSM 2132]MBK1638990.1 diaminopimelate decarboxylase [Rhodothalassium salexigens DSM 2132]TCP36462.1 diaminopimelate decarboxylase [Rhodothalassium salexigens DSM 2132]
MNHFHYRGGILFAEDVPLPVIADAVGTPVYVYAQSTLERHLTVFQEALAGLDHLVCFAVKANANMAVLRALAARGAGADVVSLGELERAVAAGIPPERIVFSGVGKSLEELSRGVALGIHQFNVESEPELERLSHMAQAQGRTAQISLRVNPDVAARTHAKIATGGAETKFGIPWTRARAVYAHAARLPGLEVAGIDVHIGSQLTDLEPFEQAFARVAHLVGQLREDGHQIRRLDLGGGLGIPYDPAEPEPPAPADYGRLVQKLAKPLGVSVIVEPGRLIAGNAGVLVTRVLFTKEGEARRFAVVDGAMNDLLRPAMYEAFHHIDTVRQTPDNAPRYDTDVVGPVCETADIFGRARSLPALAQGDLLVVRSAGAYGAVMASTYNSRPLVPEVLVKDDQWHVVRPRLDEAFWRGMDKLPPWLAH